MEYDVEDLAPRVLLVEVVPGRCEHVGYGPVESRSAAIVRRVRARMARWLGNPVALADVQETLDVALEAGLNDVTRLGVDERNVDASLLLQLGYLRLIQLLILGVGDLFGVLLEKLSEAVLLQALLEVVKLVPGDFEFLPGFSTLFVVRVHVFHWLPIGMDAAAAVLALGTSLSPSLSHSCGFVLALLLFTNKSQRSCAASTLAGWLFKFSGHMFFIYIYNRTVIL